jgi:hypothetical protein
MLAHVASLLLLSLPKRRYPAFGHGGKSARLAGPAAGMAKGLGGTYGLFLFIIRYALFG